MKNRVLNFAKDKYSSIQPGTDEKGFPIMKIYKENGDMYVDVCVGWKELGLL